MAAPNEPNTNEKRVDNRSQLAWSLLTKHAQGRERGQGEAEGGGAAGRTAAVVLRKEHVGRFEGMNCCNRTSSAATESPPYRGE